jgi:branched-chain amino acid transport system permease protein
MVLAIYAMGFNFLFGYTGLLSLGHALFFAAGMYGLGIAMNIYGLSAVPAFGIGLAFAWVVSTLIGFLALRTSGVAFMIVTLMFAQVGYLVILYFGEVTRGDEGFVIQQAERSIAGIDLTQDMNRYYAAFLLFTVVYLILVKLIS